MEHADTFTLVCMPTRVMRSAYLSRMSEERESDQWNLLRKRERVNWGWLLLPPVALSFLTLMASQSVFVVGSFRRDLGMGRVGQTFEWHNYLQFFVHDYYLQTLGLSLKVSLTATLLTVALAFPAAYVIARMQSCWSLVLLAGVVISSFVSIVVKVLGLILLFGANGPLNQILLALHLVSEPVAILGTFAGVVAGLMYYSLGFAILMFYSIIVTVPRSLEGIALSHTTANCIGA